MYEILMNPVVQGAVGGLITAAAVDLHAFVKSPNWRVEGFNWSTATKRWFTGALLGALTAGGFGWALNLPA